MEAEEHIQSSQTSEDRRKKAQTLDRQTSLEWDPFYEEPTYQPTMPVTRTPPKTAGAASTAEAEGAAAAAAEEAAHDNSVFEWQLEVNGQTLSINVNDNQNVHGNFEYIYMD